MGDIGERILKLRNRRGMSQSDLAEAIGESKQTIYKYEKGIVTNIPLQKLEALARALKCPPAVLAGWEGTSKAERLSENERVLLLKYRFLSEQDRGRVIQYMDTLLEEQRRAPADKQ